MAAMRALGFSGSTPDCLGDQPKRKRSAGVVEGPPLRSVLCSGGGDRRTVSLQRGESPGRRLGVEVKPLRTRRRRGDFSHSRSRQLGPADGVWIKCSKKRSSTGRRGEESRGEENQVRSVQLFVGERRRKRRKEGAKQEKETTKQKEGEGDGRRSWKGTSLDPRLKAPRVSLKKPKSSSSTDGAVESDEDQLFPETQPGLLSRQALKDAKSSLAYGLGETAQERTVAPVMLKYFRQVLVGSNLTRSMQKESLTLCTAIDCLLEGQVLRGMDVLMQRLKAIEMVSKGASWELAERVEVIKEKASLFSKAEASAALAESKREHRLTWEQQTWMQDGRKGKGGKSETAKGNQERTGWKGGKGKEKAGKGKEGAARTEVQRPA